MKFILIIIIVIAVVFIGLSVFDFFGYYIDWDRSVLSLAVLIPVAVAIKSLLSSPVKAVNKIKKKIDKN
jgi:hypothetical protein